MPCTTCGQMKEESRPYTGNNNIAFDLQLHNSALSPLSSPSHSHTRLLKQLGLFSLKRGFQPTMIGILPYAGLNFLTYDTLKWYYHSRVIRSRHNDSTSPPPPIPTTVRLAFGGLAGALGQTLTYPLDVVRYDAFFFSSFLWILLLRVTS